MTREQADREHWPAWDSDEIERTVGRVHVFLRCGIGADDADDLAERLTLRDREGDTSAFASRAVRSRSSLAASKTGTCATCAFGAG